MSTRSLNRREFLGLMSVMGAGVLVACAPAAAPQEGGGAAPAQATTEIVLWDYPDTENDLEIVWEPLLTEFNEGYPDIEVSVDVQPWRGRREKLYTAVAAGAPPDIWHASSDTLPAYAEKNVVAPQNEYLPAEIMEDASEWEQKLTNYSGEVQFMIMYKNVAGFAYNGTLLDEIGWSRDTPIETWDQFIEVGELAKEMGYYATTINTFDWAEWMCGVHEAGGSVFSEDGTKVLLNEQPALDTLTRWAQQYELGHVAKEHAVGSAAESSGLPNYWLEAKQVVRRAWNTDCEHHPEQVPTLDFVFGSSMQSGPSGVPTSGNLNGGGFGITQLSESKDAAASLIVWLLGFEQRGKWSTLKGRIPSGEKTLEYWEVSGCVKDWVVAQTPYLFANQDSQTLWQESKTICAPQFQAACLGIKSPEESLEQAQENLTALLEERLQTG